MFAYPNVYKCDVNGLLVGLPDVSVTSDNINYGTDTASPSDVPYRQQLLVGAENFTADRTNVDRYGDWSVKLQWTNIADPGQYYTSTLVQ